MFENIIGQGAVLQLRDDIMSGRFAPSMLFFGPGESGKGSASLELARVLSCEDKGAWKCPCSSCERHRYLQHDDLLALGKRPFSSEIAAGSAAFLRNPSVLSSKILFYRSLRKLQLRFSPVLMENDPKMSKFASNVQSFEEKLNELWAFNSESFKQETLEKLCASLIGDALVLENEGVSGNIPINQIRSVSWWARLAPSGKRKTLVIENAENMRDEARNSLLKLLEEPPPAVSIVLTAKRREAIMPTILSRLRPYRFLKRDSESEKEVIRLVFKDSRNENVSETKKSVLTEYLESFVVQNTGKLYPLAAWFIVSLARIAALSMKKLNKKPAGITAALGERYAPVAETLKLERAVKSASVIKTVCAQSGNFEDDSFSPFMKICLDMLCDVTRSSGSPQYITYNDIFKKHIGEAVSSVEILNIKEAIALESLFYNLKKAIIEG